MRWILEAVPQAIGNEPFLLSGSNNDSFAKNEPTCNGYYHENSRYWMVITVVIASRLDFRCG